MRLFVIGATGHTGRHVLDVSLSRGHTITAFVRSPDKLAGRHERLTVVRGDPLDAGAIAEALPGHDAVLSSLGVRPPAAFRPHRLVQEGAASMVAAMTRAGVTRCMLVSAAVLFPLRGIKYGFFRWMLQHIAEDLKAAENVVSATALDWTIARPPRLFEETRGSRDGYRAETGALPAGASAMSFGSLAHFLVDSVERGAHIRKVVGLAPGCQAS